MNCPNCDLINPPSAQRCDCGYDFKTQSMQMPYVRQEPAAPGRWGRWVLWFLAWTSLRGLLSSVPEESWIWDLGIWMIAITFCLGVGYAILSFFRLRGIQITNLTPRGQVMDERVTEKVAPPAEPIQRPDIGDKFFDYYLDPHPELAPDALRDCINKGVFKDPENVVWYLFVRVARDNLWLIRHYEALFRASSGGRLVILKILQQLGDEETRRLLEDLIADPQFADVRTEIQAAVEDWPAFAIDPLARPVSSRADLDLLWCEFRATGRTEPVLRIIDIFERPDRIRVKLEDWLHERPPEGRFSRFLWTQRRKRLVRRLRVEASIFCDLDRFEILTPQDLDCHCVMQDMSFDHERAQKIAKLLPFSLYGEDDRLLFKAAARWSLASHARQHAIVWDLCESEAAKRTSGCRNLLLDIAAHSALHRAD